MGIRDIANNALVEVRQHNHSVIESNVSTFIGNLNHIFQPYRFQSAQIINFTVWLEQMTFVHLRLTKPDSDNEYSNWQQVGDTDSKVRSEHTGTGVLARITGNNSTPVIYVFSSAAELGEMIERQLVMYTDTRMELPNRLDIRPYKMEVKKL